MNRTIFQWVDVLVAAVDRCFTLRKLTLSSLTALVVALSSVSSSGLAQGHPEQKHQYAQRRAALQKSQQQSAQRAQQAQRAQNQAVQQKMQAALARQRNPQPWKSQRLSNPQAKTLVIGSTMQHVKNNVRTKNEQKRGSHAHYGGVPKGLQTRINLRAEQRGQTAAKRAESQAVSRGLSSQAAQRYARFVRRQTAKDYRESRYLKHNQAFMRWTMNEKKSIQDVGYGKGASKRSPYLSGERKEVLKRANRGGETNYRMEKNAGTLSPRTWPPKK